MKISDVADKAFVVYLATSCRMEGCLDGGGVLSLNSRHYENSHTEAKRRCSTYQEFLGGFDIAASHVLQRAEEENGDFQAVRRALSHRDIATVILHGSLNHGRCESKLGFKKIAIEAYFAEIQVLDSNGAPKILSDVQVRVVVKDIEGGDKMIVVSYYKLYAEDEKEGLTEVSNVEIW